MPTTSSPDTSSIESRIQTINGMPVIVGDMKNALRSMDALSERMNKGLYGATSDGVPGRIIQILETNPGK